MRTSGRPAVPPSGVALSALPRQRAESFWRHPSKLKDSPCPANLSPSPLMTTSSRDVEIVRSMREVKKMRPHLDGLVGAARWAPLTTDETFGLQVCPQRMPGGFAAAPCDHHSTAKAWPNRCKTTAIRRAANDRLLNGADDTRMSGRAAWLPRRKPVK